MVISDICVWSTIVLFFNKMLFLILVSSLWFTRMMHISKESFKFTSSINDFGIILGGPVSFLLAVQWRAAQTPTCVILLVDREKKNNLF